MRILFDNNVPVGVRRFLTGHEVRTLVEMNWPQQFENGELLKVAEAAGQQHNKRYAGIAHRGRVVQFGLKLAF